MNRNETIKKLEYLGVLPIGDTDVRSYNVGDSDYSSHVIQPWAIWLDYPDLTTWDHDIIKRILRTKGGESRTLDYQKIIHICRERLRQLSYEVEMNNQVIEWHECTGDMEADIPCLGWGDIEVVFRDKCKARFDEKMIKVPRWGFDEDNPKDDDIVRWRYV